jgi:hypothetical protein
MKPETRNLFLETCGRFLRVKSLKLLTSHARAHAIVADLSAAGCVVRHKHGRRNRYQIQAHLPLTKPASQETAIGDVLAFLAGARAVQNLRRSAPSPDREGSTADSAETGSDNQDPVTPLN